MLTDEMLVCGATCHDHSEFVRFFMSSKGELGRPFDAYTDSCWASIKTSHFTANPEEPVSTKVYPGQNKPQQTSRQK